MDIYEPKTITAARIDEAARTYAVGFADDTLVNDSPESRQQLEMVIRTSFNAGALEAMRLLREMK